MSIHEHRYHHRQPVRNPGVETEQPKTGPSYREIVTNGLWANNPALVQLLGLCPLLAVTGSVVNALGLGMATTLVLTSSNLVISSIRHQVGPAVRLPAFVMIIASPGDLCRAADAGIHL